MKLIINFLISSLIVLSQAAIAETFQVPEGESVTFYHTDHLGSPVIATDPSGDLIWESAYSGYGDSEKTYSSGAVSAPTQTEPKDNIGFTGHEVVDYTDLVYMKARWYHPRLGRFLQPDSVGFVQSNSLSVNRYVYSNNNPILNTDPDGRYFEFGIEIASISAGLTSMGFNFANGNVREGLIDLAFVAVDGVGLAIPIAPGVSGLARQGYVNGAEIIAKESDDLVTIGGIQWQRVTPKDGEGVIYIIPEGDATIYGLPYVGRADDLPTRARTARDGRDRCDAVAVCVYPKGDTVAKRRAEQETINRFDGIRNLDNMRNEIAKHKWAQYDIFSD